MMLLTTAPSRRLQVQHLRVTAVFKSVSSITDSPAGDLAGAELRQDVAHTD
jgi:hypothetical protein